jgi:DNA-binding response OmpR family regulator
MTESSVRCALVVEDVPDVRLVVATVLRGEGYTVEERGDGRDGVDAAQRIRPELIVLDLNLPSLGGVEVCRAIREFSSAYVLVLSGLHGELDKVLALSAGADDYVTKPFSTAELAARVRALQRRPRELSSARAGTERRFGPLAIDTGAREVRVNDRPVGLTRTEFDLLDVLSGSPRVAFSRAQLVARVWGPHWYGDDHLVDVHISNLRRKLGDDPRRPRFVFTVRGVGYRMGTGESAFLSRGADMLAHAGDLAPLLAFI